MTHTVIFATLERDSSWHCTCREQGDGWDNAVQHLADTDDHHTTHLVP